MTVIALSVVDRDTAARTAATPLLHKDLKGSTNRPQRGESRMALGEGVVLGAALATHELALFAAVGMAIGGLDDLAIDLIWLARTLWRRLAVYTRHPRADARLLGAGASGTVAVFVPAWREAAVIGPMLQLALERWRDADVRIYVGCYPNDPATWDAARAVAARDQRVRLVLNPRGIM